jgi:hypothetical protein
LIAQYLKLPTYRQTTAEPAAAAAAPAAPAAAPAQDVVSETSEGAFGDFEDLPPSAVAKLHEALGDNPAFKQFLAGLTQADEAGPAVANPAPPDDFAISEGGKHHDRYAPSADKVLASYGFPEKDRDALKAAAAPWTTNTLGDISLPIGSVRGVMARRGFALPIQRPASLAGTPIWELHGVILNCVVSAANGVVAPLEGNAVNTDPAYINAYRWNMISTKGYTQTATHTLTPISGTENLQNTVAIFVACPPGTDISPTKWGGFPNDVFFAFQAPDLMGERSCYVTGVSLKFVNTTPELDRGGSVRITRQYAPPEQLCVHTDAAIDAAGASEPSGPYCVPPMQVVPVPSCFTASGRAAAPTAESITFEANHGFVTTLPINYSSFPARNPQAASGNIAWFSKSQCATGVGDSYEFLAMPGVRAPQPLAAAPSWYDSQYAEIKTISNCMTNISLTGLTAETTFDAILYIASLDMPTRPDDTLMAVSVMQEPLDFKLLSALESASFAAKLGRPSDHNGFGSFLFDTMKAIAPTAGSLASPLVDLAIDRAARSGGLPGVLGKGAQVVRAAVDKKQSRKQQPKSPASSNPHTGQERSSSERAGGVTVRRDKRGGVIVDPRRGRR